MRVYPTLFLIFFTTTVPAAEIGGGIWKNCPGPACPADSPDIGGSMHKNADSVSIHKEDDQSLKAMDTHELNDKKLELEKEIRAIDKEKQHREVAP
ncbi:MAG: hypothetical protein Q7U10_06905 [Thermodesulfovibrionia bacterium]|nr:hypothetical protein [Thermodesulfovibrionia bacterium]